MAMALPIGTEPQTPSLSTPRTPQDLRNPLPLSASQEAQVRSIYYARVRSRCGDEIKGTQLPFAPTSDDAPIPSGCTHC